MANYGSYVKKTASCPLFGDWAIANKLTVKWGNARRGDIVLFDFNQNGTSDHIGIVTKVASDHIETIEGNTGSGSNTNGDGVYRRKRYKSQVNYFVRTKCPDTEAVIKRAEAELGYKEGSNNSNKYGKWFGMNNVSWCCIFVYYCFANAKPTPKKYTGKYPYLPKLIERKALEFAYPKGTPLSKCGYRHGKAKPAYSKAIKAEYGSSVNHWSAQCRKGASCDVFVGTCVRATYPKSKMPRGLSEQKGYLKKHFGKGKHLSGNIGFKDNHILIYTHLKGKRYVVNAHHNKNHGMYGIVEADRKMPKYYANTTQTSLRKGDIFTSVLYMQKFLKWAGYYGGKLDSYFGEVTERALKQFQKAHGLKGDGICGPNTIKKMKEVRK